MKARNPARFSGRGKNTAFQARMVHRPPATLGGHGGSRGEGQGQGNDIWLYDNGERMMYDNGEWMRYG